MRYGVDGLAHTSCSPGCWNVVHALTAATHTLAGAPLPTALVVGALPFDSLSFATNDMYLPSILPDEFLKGYVERATQFLGMHSSMDARLFLARAHGLKDNYAAPLYVLLAPAIEMDETEVLASHTLENMRTAFAGARDPRCNAAWRRQDDRAGRSGLLFSAKLPGICHQCVSQDLKDRGCSYWRRLHLIHGIEYCPSHPDHRLFRVARKNAFKRPPQAHLEETYIDNENRDPKIGGRIVGSLERRYLAACRLLLDRDQPIASHEALSKVIAKTAATTSLDGRLESFLGQHPLVPAIERSMKCETSNGWLASSFPELTPATLNRFIRTLINQYQRSSTENYILCCLHLDCWDQDVSVQAFHEWLNRHQ